MLQTKLASIRRVLDYARQAGVQRMLVTSSGAVYGPQPAELSHIPETYNGAPDPMNPASAYGHGKRLVEQMCALTPEVPCVIARCFSFVGPHLPLNGRFAAGNFLRDALAGKTIAVMSDGMPYRSYMHPADLVIWLLKMLLRGRAGRPYNLGSDQSVSLADLAKAIAAAWGVSSVIAIRDQQATDAAKLYVPAISRAQIELDLKVSIGLTQALDRTAIWLRKPKDAPYP